MHVKRVAYLICAVFCDAVRSWTTECQMEVRFDVFTAVTMKNVVFWDIKPQFVLHRRDTMSPLQSSAS
jgi:hypothetical protein